MATQQWSATIRNGWIAFIESTLGTSPKVELRTGGMPANVAAADSGTLVVSCVGASDWLAAPSGGSASTIGTFSGSVSVNGTVGHYRLKTSGGTCHEQGNISAALPLVTTAATSANSNVLTFASAAAVSVGQAVSGTGIPSGATVLSKTTTTVTLSAVSTAGVSSGATVYFGDPAGKLWLPTLALTAGQVLTLTRTFIAPGA